jgi:glycosyltransferase involved in cell wall biosynthesis
MTNLSISNSPVGAKRYHRSKRLMFLFAALRTRSLMARNELSTIALGSVNSYVELINRVQSASLNKSDVYNLGALRDLAWLLSNQTVHESDLAGAARLYEWVVANYSWRRMPHMHRVAYALCALRLGQVQAARGAVSTGRFSRRLKWSVVTKKFLPKVFATTRVQQVGEAMNYLFMFGRDYSLPLEFLQVDIANPFRGKASKDIDGVVAAQDSKSWLDRFSNVLLGDQLSPIFLKAAAPGAALEAPFERMTASAAALEPEALRAGPKVSVVVSAFEPNEHIFTSINSILAQTHQNLEVLVIDDASPLSFDPILQRVAALDARVKVLRQAANGGTYRIRNRALDDATGELITFQDSDDWMHPMRLELQVGQLLKNEKTVANISMSTRLTERLEAAESGRRLRIGICEPALLFWREKVRDKIGYFDTVRKGGDTEYRRRLERAFDTDVAMVLPWRTLTIQRADNGGLTQGELGFRWITEFRTQYRDSYLHWHRGAGKAVGWHLGNSEVRAFYAPRQSALVGADARAPQNFNLVVVANFRDPINTAAALVKIQSALDAGLSVGLLQVNCVYPLHLSRAIGAAILDLLNAGKVQLLQPHFELQVGKLELLAPNAWLSSWAADRFEWRVAEVWPVAPVDASESFVLAGSDLAAELARQLSQAFGSAALVVGS